MSTNILNSFQSREYKRAEEMQLLFEANTKIYNLSNPFTKEVELFLSNNKKIQALVSIKKEKGNGITTDKGILKSDLAVAVGFICAMTTAYAIKIKDNNLKSSVDYTESAIKAMIDPDILGFVTSIVGIVTPLLSGEEFSGYSITAETLSSAMEQANAFNSTIGKASMVDISSSIASRNINEVFKDIRDNITQFNLLIAFFKKSHPDFVKAYQRAILINNSGIHHSGIRGSVTNSLTGAVVQGVTLTLTGKKTARQTITAKDGSYEIIKVLAGKATLTITAPGYESRTVDLTIFRGKILTLNFGLEAQVINLATA